MPYRAGMNTIVETPGFIRRATRIWSDAELDEFINFIAENPLSGAVIPGTGGIRKVRWGRQGAGKRGGVRVVYYNKTTTETWLLTVYAKSETETLSMDALIMMREEING